MTDQANIVTEPGLAIERIFDAPVELVWQAWTQPEHLEKWFGPKDFTAPAVQNDFHVGGKYLYCMRSPDGQDYWSTGVYREIIQHRRIVATDSFADADGNVVPASHYGMQGDFPIEMQTTVTFEAQGNRTKLTINQAGMPAGMQEMAGTGWNQSLDKLAAHLAAI